MAKLARYLKTYCFDPSAEEMQAKEIMGPNFVGVANAILHFQLSRFGMENHVEKHHRLLQHIPYHWSTLRQYRKTHSLIACFNWSITGIRHVHESLIDEGSFRALDCSELRTFRDKGLPQPAWILIQTKPLAGSTNKTYGQQKEMLGDRLIPATLFQAIYATIAEFLQSDNGWKKSPDISTPGSIATYANTSCARCAKVSGMDGLSTMLSTHNFSGGPQHSGIRFGMIEDTAVSETLGIATVVKPDRPYEPR